MTEYSFEDRISRSIEAKKQRAFNKGLIGLNALNSKKYIRTVSIKGIPIREYENISASGEVLPIKISGSPGAMFSLTITDSSGCSILEEKIENVKINNSGVYNLIQSFPSIKSVKQSIGKITNEKYTITFLPSADTVVLSPASAILNQYNDVTLTFSKDVSDSSISALTFTGADVTKTNSAYRRTNSIQDYSDLTFSLAVKYTSYSAGNIYVKSTDYNNNIIKSSAIKAIAYRDGNTDNSIQYYFSPSSTITETTAENGTLIKTDIPVGSKAKWTTTREKFVIASLDKDDNIIDFDNCKNKRTNIFKISDTNDISSGMAVTGQGIRSFVSSISNCKTKIFLTNKFIIKPNTVLTFLQKNSASVVSSEFDTVKSGKIAIGFNRKVNIPEQTEVTFDDDKSIVIGSISQVGSGNTGNGDANDLDLTCTISVKKFDRKNITYNLDVSKIISVKPNAYDQSVVTAKNTAILINMIKFDSDTNASSKTGSVVRPPSHGVLSSYVTSSDSFLYTPNNNFTGSDSFTFTMSDSTNTSDEKTVLIEVLEGASGTSDVLA
tara:strand:- start:494 stop:2146 length:1653 start_codon:yes stop_codon:yes gene_type:complete